MRPHLLRVTAFGAFGGPAEVCFDALADSGLFLLHGETGAGKTTLLDAIGFALYGRVPGERGKAKRLRSDHAPATARTEVTFEATIGERRLRITRSPQQARPKLHGSGMTTEPARVLVEEETAGTWHAVSTRANEADREIADAMGMSAEQFYQVVLLPQGQFARFLHADADERRALLQRLFRTDRFRAVEDWLAERRRATAGQVQDEEQALARLAARIGQVAGVPVPGQETEGAAPSGGTMGSAPSGGTVGSAPSGGTVGSAPSGGTVGSAPSGGTVGSAPSGGTVGSASSGGTAEPAAPSGRTVGPAHSGGTAGPAASSGGRAESALTASWAERLAAAAASVCGEAAAQAGARKRGLDQALAALADVRRLADRQTRRTGALRRSEELRAAEPGMAGLRQELAAAGRAAEIARAFTEADRAAETLTAARSAEEAARVAAAAAGLPAGAGAAEFRAAAQERDQRVGRLEALREQATRADQEDALAATARQRAEVRAADLRDCERALTDQRARRQSLAAGRDAARLASERLPAVRVEAGRQRAAAGDAAALAEARAGQRGLHEQRATARETALGLREKALRIREERFDGMIAELAASLVDDTPCPVCGSLDHPDPSEIRACRITHQEEEQASAEADAAREAVAKLDGELAGLDVLASDLTARLVAAGVADPALGDGALCDGALFDLAALGGAPAGGAPADRGPADDGTVPDGKVPDGIASDGIASDGTVPDRAGPGQVPDAETVTRLRELAAALGEAADGLEAEAARLDQAAGTLAQHESDLTDLDTAMAQNEKRQGALTEQQQAALAEADAARNRAEGYRASLASQLDGAPDLEAAITAVRDLARALATAAAAAEATAAAVRDTERAEGEAERAAAGAGFADMSAARAAMRPADWRAAVQDTIRAHEAEVAAIARQLEDPDLDVPLEPPADVAGAETAVELAQAAYDEAVSGHSRATEKESTLAGLVPEFTAKLTALEPLRERAAEARRLADLAAGLGANTLKMTLSSFVLAARLEEVAEAASQRLLTMTAGRYSLAHTDARRGGGRAGLGLLACDAWTGQERDTSTLSGGETFLASLALALGLADVVTAEAAGVAIEALFVDEGFGSLDEETLDEVMSVLDGLREGGRMVGIVSHVTELRQRIPAQVHVRKGRRGSSVELITS